MNTSVNQCMSLHYYTPDLHKLSKVVEILEYLDNALAVYILRFVYEFDQSEQLFFFISLLARSEQLCTTILLILSSCISLMVCSTHWLYSSCSSVSVCAYNHVLQKRLDKTMSLQQNFSIIYSRFYNF